MPGCDGGVIIRFAPQVDDTDFYILVAPQNVVGGNLIMTALGEHVRELLIIVPFSVLVFPCPMQNNQVIRLSCTNILQAGGELPRG